MKKSYIIPIAFGALMLASCAEDFESHIDVNKPVSVEEAERLSQLDVLKSYIDRSQNPNFTLGLVVNSADYASQGLTYSIAKTNFDVVMDATASSFGTTMANDGTTSFATLSDMFLEDGPKVISGPLIAYNSTNRAQLEQVIAANFVKGDLQQGKLTLADFDSDAVGTVYEMSNGSVATVVEDPKGQSGNVLMVGSEENKAKNSYAVVNVTLPNGLTLGNVRTIYFDIMLIDATSAKKNLVMILAGVRKNFTGDTPDKRGCPVGDWARKIIEFNVSDVALTEAELGLSTFTVALGPNIVNSYYYIDNISATWETGEPDKYVEKTPEEKSQALEENFNLWANALMEVSSDKVSDYVVVAYPMSDADAYMQRDTENETELGNETDDMFFLNEYMGDNYVVTLTKGMKQAYKGSGALKLYVKEGNLLGNPGKTSRLLKQIADWKAAGAQIDGIAVDLQLEYTVDADQLAINKANVADLFKSLATSGLIIRLDNVSMTNANADYYRYVVDQYKQNISGDKRGGIIFSGTGDLWRDNSRTAVYEAVALGLK